jgi:hypothetical protein
MEINFFFQILSAKEIK